MFSAVAGADASKGKCKFVFLLPWALPCVRAHCRLHTCLFWRLVPTGKYVFASDYSVTKDGILAVYAGAAGGGGGGGGSVPNYGTPTLVSK